MEGSISLRFDRIAASHSSGVAYRSASERCSYGQLSGLAGRVTSAISSRLPGGGERIAVVLPTSARFLGAALGVMRARHVFVPIDPASAPVRARYIARDARCRLVLAEEGSRDFAREIAGDVVEVLLIEDLPPGSAAAAQPVADDLCWILYTSGSTGNPKGVMQTHRSVLSYVRSYVLGECISDQDHLALIVPASTNAGMHEALTGLLNGAEIHRFDFRSQGSRAFAKWISEQGVTICQLPPTLFRTVCDALDGSGDFSSLRLIKFVSEPSFRTDFELFRSHFPRSCTLLNRYGSTETGTARWHFLNHESRVESELLPIGFSAPDHELRIVLEDGSECPAGEVGEVEVRSPYLCSGYWNLPERTEAAFRALPEAGLAYRMGDLARMDRDGCVTPIGRLGDRVNIRGFFVEAGEVTTQLRALPYIDECLVVARHDSFGETWLIGYYVAAESEQPSVSRLRKDLAERLSEHMIPARFVAMAEVPVSDNGKVLRSALPEPGAERPRLKSPYRPPETPLEAEVAAIWCEVLQFDTIGCEDDFFELGGDSLKAARTAVRLQNGYSLDIPLSVLFERPTVAGVSCALVDAEFASMSAQEVAGLRSGEATRDAAGDRNAPN